MKCFVCSSELTDSELCLVCGVDNTILFDLTELSSICYNDALDLIGQHKISDAIQLLNQAIQINKTNVEALNLLGLCLFRIGNFSDAFDTWRYSLLVNEFDNEAQRYLEVVNNTDFINSITEGIKLYNKSIDFLNENNEKYAIMQLKKVVRLIPNFLDANLLLSVLLIQNKNYSQAYQQVKKVIFIDSNNVEALRYKSEIEHNIEKMPVRNSGFVEIKRKKDILKNFDKISIGSWIVSLTVGFIVGLLFMLFLTFPAIKNSEISTNKDLFTQKNQEITDLKIKLDELNKSKNDTIDELNKVKKDLNGKGEDVSEIQNAIFIAAQSKYESKDYKACKKICDLGVKYLSDNSDLYILWLRSIILTQGVSNSNEAMKVIEEKFKDKKEVIQKAKDIIEDTKKMNAS